MNITDTPVDGRKNKKAYAPPKLIIYGKARTLTRSGASGTPEGPGKSPTKRA